MVHQEDDTLCYRCNDSCYGDVVHLGGNYYHQYCFTCKKCNIDLVDVGYFEIDGEFYCNKDYHLLMGTKCDGCGKFIEGETVSAIDSNFHPECFGCNRCGKVFPPGAKINYDGEDFFCDSCDTPQPQSPKEYSPVEQPAPVEQRVVDVRPSLPSYEQHVTPQKEPASSNDESANCCAGCGNDIKSGQALLALEKQWHLWCFTCHKCGCLLAGEYMGRDGVPYCEQDYQAEFGVSCAGCGGYITGKVLQAGEKHYHPHCSRCAKCGDMFGEGEEMYLQGSEIWHPHCSEEYQRENEELERVAEAANQRRSPQASPQLRVTTRISPDHHSPPQVETFSFGMSEAPQRSPNITTATVPHFNGYNNHAKQNSNSSDGSADHRNNNVQKPSPNENNNTSYKPVGFRSVRPPQPVVTTSHSQKVIKPPTPDASDDDAPPPVPPPPSRSSSSGWKQKYGQPRSAVNVQSANKEESKGIPLNIYPNSNLVTKKVRPLSFVESAAARNPPTRPTYQVTAKTSRTTVSISSTSRTESTSSSNDGRDERDNTPKTSVKKGVGFNKLQQRKMIKENSLTKTNGYNGSQEKELDPEVLRKLNSDPNGNTYPYEVLKTNSYKTPPNINRKILETYLTDSEFFDVFRMTRDKFYSLPKWKQEEMKKRVTLF